VRSTVLAAALGFAARFEGRVDGMYCDVLGLVTTGYGDLIDSVQAAQSLPWLHRGTVSGVADVPATPDEVAAEWRAVKLGRIPAWKGPRPLYLSAAGLASLFMGRLNANETILAKRWSNWPLWPADAQMAGHSCAWAAGAAWRAPRLDAAAAALDFATMAGPDGDANHDPGCRGEAWLDDVGNPGLRPRNLANKILFANAEAVMIHAASCDPAVLYYPHAIPSEAHDTQPAPPPTPVPASD